MSAKIEWYGEKIPSPTDSFCDTCGTYENHPIDKITLREAVETDAWLMVWAGEPGRNINVQMTYDDLWRIRRWIVNLEETE